MPSARRLLHPAAQALAAAGILAAFAARAETPSAPKDGAATSAAEWMFDLVPKPFQRNPRFNLTVLTELSPEGKQRPEPSREKPAYFALHSGGYVTKGTPLTGERNVTAEKLEDLLRRALATSGHLPATPDHPPSLLIVYHWGFHGIVTGEESTLPPDLVRRNIYDRAALVGGDAFAAELKKVTEQSLATWDASARPLGTGNDPDSMDLGAAAGLAQMSRVMDPLKLFMQRSPRNEFLVHQATDDCYFVIASAFDYRSAGTPQKQLLWRTRLTINARGIAQADALPVAIATAAPHFGHPMADVLLGTKRSLRDGAVEIGTPTVVEPPPAPAAAPR